MNNNLISPSSVKEGRGSQTDTLCCGAETRRMEVQRVQSFLDSITFPFPGTVSHEFAPVTSQGQRHFLLCKRIHVCEFFPILLNQRVFQRHLWADFVKLMMPVVFLAKVFPQSKHTEILLCRNGAWIYPVVFFRDKSVERTAFVTDNRFVGLPLLIFTIVFIPPVFIGVHYLILILMNVVLLALRSDRDVWRHRSENDLSVIGIIRSVVVSPAPFFYVFSVPYFSDAISSVITSGSLSKTGGGV